MNMKIVLKTPDSKRPLNEGQVVVHLIPKIKIHPECKFCGDRHRKNRCPMTPF